MVAGSETCFPKARWRFSSNLSRGVVLIGLDQDGLARARKPSGSVECPGRGTLHAPNSSAIGRCSDAFQKKAETVVRNCDCKTLQSPTAPETGRLTMSFAPHRTAIQ